MFALLGNFQSKQFFYAFRLILAERSLCVCVYNAESGRSIWHICDLVFYFGNESVFGRRTDGRKNVLVSFRKPTMPPLIKVYVSLYVYLFVSDYGWWQVELWDTVWMNIEHPGALTMATYIPVDVAYTATYTLAIEAYELLAFEPVLLPPVNRVLLICHGLCQLDITRQQRCGSKLSVNPTLWEVMPNLPSMWHHMVARPSYKHVTAYHTDTQRHHSPVKILILWYRYTLAAATCFAAPLQRWL